LSAAIRVAHRLDVNIDIDRSAEVQAVTTRQRYFLLLVEDLTRFGERKTAQTRLKS
jgi:hypothetical protein